PGGVCMKGACCTGCIDDRGECQSGSDAKYCGLGGVACDTCKDDGNPCTADICTPEGRCEHVPVADGVSCETDGDVCNGTSRCEKGTCKPGTPLNCVSPNPCLTVRCDKVLGCVTEENENPCEDGNPCTVNDRCKGGKCQAGKPAKCDDNEFCTVDDCDPAHGCVHTPREPGTECDDRNECSTASACNALGRCVATAGKDCSDDNPCTVNGCNVATDSCDFSQLEE